MLNNQLIDKRIVERNIKKGRVDAAEYGRTLATLPDLSQKLWRRDESREQVAAVSAPVAPPVAAPAAAPTAAAPAAAAPAAAAPAAAAPESAPSEPSRSGFRDDNPQPIPIG
jgi:hypothetical protein